MELIPKRTLCFGDVHGGLKGLIQVLERANFDKNMDQLIGLGDYVDGWGDSAPLISYLIELEKECVFKPIFLRGNHDDWCESWMTTGLANKDWTDHGGKTTLASYVEHNLLGNSKHTMFLYKLHNYYIDDKNRLFVHGGFTSENGVIGQSPRILLWNRDLFELAYFVHNRTIKRPKERERTYPKRLKAYDEIFVGHTTTLIYGTDKPLNVLNLWNLDTGAGTNGKISIIDVDTKEYWQSDYLTELYVDDIHNEFASKFKNKFGQKK